MKINDVSYFFAAFIFIPFSLFSSQYDRAIREAQDGRWKESYERLNNILTNEPDRADILYDTGLAAYNLGNFSQAISYFLHAAENAKNDVLRSKSYFNLGNSSVAEKNLENAIVYYEKALELDPEDNYARHNRDRVKQMLEEQKNNQKQQDKQEQNKDQNEQNKNDQNQNGQNDRDAQNKQDDKQDKRDDANGQDQDNNAGQDDNSDAQSHKNDQKEENGQGNKSSQESKQSGSEQESGKDSNEGKKAERKNGRDKKEKQEDAPKNDKRDGDQELKNKPDNTRKKGNNEKSNEHKNAPGNELNDINKNSVSSEFDQSQIKNDDNFEQRINDPWLLQILKDQEKSDKSINKQIMEAKIRQHGGKHGQNCW